MEPIPPSVNVVSTPSSPPVSLTVIDEANPLYTITTSTTVSPPTLTRTIKTLLHAPSLLSLTTSILTNLPSYLPPISLFNTQINGPTSALHFIVYSHHHTNATRIPQLFELHLHLKSEIVTNHSGTTSIIRITSYTPAQTRSFESASYAAKLDSLRAQSSRNNSTPHVPPAQFRVTGTITLTPSVYNTVECTGTFTAKTTPSATPPVIPSGIVDKLKTTNATMDTRMNTMSALASANESNDSYPISVANKLMERLVAAVRTLHETYANYAAVDESMYRQFLAGIPTAPPLTASEKSIITTNLTFDDHEAQLAKLEVTRAHGVTAPSTPTKCTAPNMWHRIPSTVKSPVAYFQKFDSDNDGGWGKATATVDCSAEMAFAYLFCLDAWQRVKQHIDVARSEIIRKVINIPKTHSLIYVNQLILPSPLSDRIFATWFCWERNDTDGSFMIAWAPYDHMIESPDSSPSPPSSLLTAAHSSASAFLSSNRRAAKAVRATTKGFWRIKPLASSVCSVMVVGKGTLAGNIPIAVLNSRLKSQVSTVEDLQTKFERANKTVDAEIRAAFPRPPLLERLSQDQKDVFKDCRALEEDDAGRDGKLETIRGGTLTTFRKWGEAAGFRPLGTASNDVKMWIKHAPSKQGERHVALGKAVATIDCSAMLAMAWWFTFDSKSRVKINRPGDRGRFIHKHNTQNDNVFATIKKMPFPLYSREFVARQICALDVNGDLLCVQKSCPDVADFGTKIKTVRAVSRQFARIVQLAANESKITLYQYLDAGGTVPTTVINSKIPQALSSVDELRMNFQRDVEVDEARCLALAALIRDSRQIYTPDENAILQNVQQALGALKDDDFDVLESPDSLVKMEITTGAMGGTGRAVATIDASVEDCAAWEMDKMSRAQRNASHLKKSLRRINDHHHVYGVLFNTKVSGFKPRRFCSSMIWKDEIVVYEHSDRYDTSTDGVMAKQRAVWKYEKLQAASGIPQTRVTYTNKADLGGAMPGFVVKKGAVSQLKRLSRMRKHFDKSQEFDERSRAATAEMIRNHADSYSVEEEMHFVDALAWFDMFEVAGNKKQVKMASSLANAQVGFKAGDNRVWGWSSSSVRAEPEEVMGYFWDVNLRSKEGDNLNLQRFLDETPNDHNMLLYVKLATPKVIADRDFLSRVLWKKHGTGFVQAIVPEESEKRITLRGEVRGKYPSCLKVLKTENGETKLIYVINPDIGGSVPVWILNRQVKHNLAVVSNIQEYFQGLRKLAEWDERDGKAVGEMPSFERMRGLREARDKWEWFKPMLTRVLEGNLRPACDCKSALVNLSAREGATVGAGLVMALATNLTAVVAVDEWILKYKSLGEFDRQEKWFRPMMEAVATKLLGEVSWGLKGRVAIGAMLSVADMVSDAFVIFKYMDEASTRGYGWILLWMLMGNLAMQLLLVLVQYKKKPLELLKECLIVATGAKPVVDAFRISSGKEQEGHHVFSPLVELVAGKVCEMFGESIPGCLLQCFVFLKGERSRASGASIIVSALMTGFASASISFDFDVSPAKRNESPEFYGYIPDDGRRTIIFCCMMLNSSLTLLIRAVGGSLLMLMEKKNFVVLLLGEMGLYLLQKALRGDLIYWTPGLGIRLSLVMRMVVKVVTDFTGLVHFRGPHELGGAYWTFNMALGLVGGVGSVMLYDGEEAEKGALWNVMGGLVGGWIAVFLVFLQLMKKRYRSGFFSLQTSKSKSIAYFLDGKNDADKAEVMKSNERQWREVREQVKDWVQEGWWRWSEEKPQWFSPAWIGRVPLDMIPTDAGREELKGFRESTRRRSSLVGLVGGGGGSSRGVVEPVS